MGRFVRFLRRVVGSPYVKHPLLSILGAALVLSLSFLGLNIFTRHGAEFPLPDLCGISLVEALEHAQRARLRIVVVDSSYIITRKPGEVLAQQPEAGQKVKRNRRVFLSINAMRPMLVEMPNLEGEAVRQAVVMLEQVGLEVGRIAYAPDFAFNSVLGQSIGGKSVEPGSRIAKGTLVDLMLGDGLEEHSSVAPELIGLTLAESRSALAIASLNVGRVQYDETVKSIADSLAARVYSTHPKALRHVRLPLASGVDLWLTLNAARMAIERASVREEEERAAQEVEEDEDELE